MENGGDDRSSLAMIGRLIFPGADLMLRLDLHESMKAPQFILSSYIFMTSLKEAERIFNVPFK